MVTSQGGRCHIDGRWASPVNATGSQDPRTELWDLYSPFDAPSSSPGAFQSACAACGWCVWGEDVATPRRRRERVSP